IPTAWPRRLITAKTLCPRTGRSNFFGDDAFQKQLDPLDTFSEQRSFRRPRQHLRLRGFSLESVSVISQDPNTDASRVPPVRT
ncbi:MAG: hypothetical protein KDA52_13880, partial [Planctomycetaceae bacterium]|nr:hypothetical protein [Planctomycetaceae bacterium]